MKIVSRAVDVNEPTALNHPGRLLVRFAYLGSRVRLQDERIATPRAQGENRPELVRLGEPPDHALGRSRGGFTTKLHLVTDGRGLPLAVTLSAGEAHESVYAARVLDAVRVPRRRPGRPRRRPAALAGDKGYSYPTIRDQTRHRMRRGHRAPAFDRAAYRRRSAIECTVGALKEARAVATRSEKLAIHYRALVQLSTIRLLVRRIERPLSHKA